MARLRYNGLTATLGGSGLTSSGTTITFAAALSYAGGAVPTLAGSDYIPLSILGSSDPDSAVSEIVYLTAYTSGATTGTITRAQESTAGTAHAAGVVAVHGPTVADVESGAVLAFAQATTSATYSTSSTTDADVDATNLVLPVTFPGSGKVMVELSATTDCTATAADWTLRTGTTTVAACTMGNAYSRKSAYFYLTGTPGATVTYKWGHRRIGGTGTANIYTGGAGGVSGNAMMRAVAMP